MRLFIQHDFYFFQSLLIFIIYYRQQVQFVVAITASSIFYSPPFPDPGNCHGYDMDSVVTDAYTLTSNALNVLNILIQDNIPLNPQNIIFVKAASTLWGVQCQPTSPSTVAITLPGKFVLREVAGKR
jgi:hypothetical protein